MIWKQTTTKTDHLFGQVICAIFLFCVLGKWIFFKGQTYKVRSLVANQNRPLRSDAIHVFMKLIYIASLLKMRYETKLTQNKRITLINNPHCDHNTFLLCRCLLHNTRKNKQNQLLKPIEWIIMEITKY